MISVFSNALSELTQDHIRLSRTRRETLIWLVLLMLRHGTVCLWRLAAHAPGRAQTASVRRRFYRLFQFVRIDADATARLVVQLLRLDGKPWILAVDRMYGWLLRSKGFMRFFRTGRLQPCIRRCMLQRFCCAP